MAAKGKARADDGAAGFVRKLYSMVDDPDIDAIVWTDDGDSFIIADQHKLQHDILARFFKHNKVSSLIRQLNMYDFNKVQHLDEGTLVGKAGEELLEFRNPYFQRGRPDLLRNLERKKSSGEKGGTGRELALPPGLDPHAVFAKLTEIREEQKALGKEFRKLEQENAMLWQEAQSSRELHKRNTESINAIVRFLGSVYGSNTLEGGQAGVAGLPKPTSATSIPSPTQRRLLLKDVPKRNGVPASPEGDERSGEAPRSSRSRMTSDTPSTSSRFEEVPTTDELDPQLSAALSALASHPQIGESDGIANLLSSYNFSQNEASPSTSLQLLPRQSFYPPVVSSNALSYGGLPAWSPSAGDPAASLPTLIPNLPSDSLTDNLEKRRSANMAELDRISGRTDMLQGQIDELMRGLLPANVANGEQVENLDDDFWNNYLNETEASPAGAKVNGDARIESLSRSPSLVPSDKGRKRSSDDDDYAPAGQSSQGPTRTSPRKRTRRAVRE